MKQKTEERTKRTKKNGGTKDVRGIERKDSIHNRRKDGRTDERKDDRMGENKLKGKKNKPNGSQKIYKQNNRKKKNTTEQRMEKWTIEMTTPKG